MKVVTFSFFLILFLLLLFSSIHISYNQYILAEKHLCIIFSTIKYVDSSLHVLTFHLRHYHPIPMLNT